MTTMIIEMVTKVKKRESMAMKEVSKLEESMVTGVVEGQVISEVMRKKSIIIPADLIKKRITTQRGNTTTLVGQVERITMAEKNRTIIRD